MTSTGKETLGHQYNGALDFWKLIFTILVVLYHAGEIREWDNVLPIGYTAVEFFFILSGYFMAVSASRKPKVIPGTLGKETAGFIWHKIKAILPYYLFAYTLSFLSYIYYILRGRSARVIVEKLSRVIPNFLLLSTSGIKESTVLGTTWYISAMLLAMCFLYPLLRKYWDMYLHVIAPLSAILVAGYLCNKYGNFGLSYDLDVFISQKLVRSVVGLNIGCTVYVVSEKIKMVRFSTLSRILLALVEWGCYLWILLAMHYMKADYVFTLLFLYFFALTITTSKQSVLGSAFDHRIMKTANQFSLALYLCHSACRRVMVYSETDWGYLKSTVIFTAFSLITALVCMVVVKYFRRFLNSHSENIKKFFLKTA